MSETTADPQVLSTSEGDFPLQEFRLPLGGREIGILHTNALLSQANEAEFLFQFKHIVPYGVALWPSAIALAQEVAARADAMRATSVLELGAGTGLPGIVAAALGARVVQTDKEEVAMELCRRNGERNGIASVDYRLVDWTAWGDAARYDWIIGSDVLYGETVHPHVRRIFETNLAAGGRILLSDPFRAMSIRFLEALEADGWKIAMTRWSVGEGPERRAIGVFELAPPK
ncbi:MAG TPA: methyltransferase domain-containing protein [Longimicrobiaceae bacterium]